MDSSCQTYQLFLLLKRDAEITIGKLGTFKFPAGRYIYTGSAKKNMTSRLGRHLSSNKKIHWHIDYLLCHQEVKVIGIERFAEQECQVNQHTEGEIVVRGFGASDCKQGCGSHLKYRGS